MKRFIYSVVAMLALSCTFVACGDDNDDPSINYDKTAAQGSAGTYSGTWTRTGDAGTETFSGTVLLSPDGDGAGNKTLVLFSCPETNLEATSVANVWHANYGYQFVNQTLSNENGLGATFAGRIDENGALNASFTVSQRVGRQNIEYQYEFLGKK